MDKPKKTWQPIDTAPKDGTAILVAGGLDCEHMYARNAAQSLLSKSPCRVMWDGHQWMIAICEAGYNNPCVDSPTHWMPLPEPPNG